MSLFSQIRAQFYRFLAKGMHRFLVRDLDLFVKKNKEVFDELAAK